MSLPSFDNPYDAAEYLMDMVEEASTPEGYKHVYLYNVSAGHGDVYGVKEETERWQEGEWVYSLLFIPREPCETTRGGFPGW